MSTPNADGSLTLTAQERTNLVEWLSEMLDPLSYQVAPDPNPLGIAIRLRGQGIKHIMLADPPPPPPPPPSVPILMYDSVDPTAIPLDAKLVAGYIDGRVSDWAGDYDKRTGAWARWPSTTGLFSISAIGSGAAGAYDDEPGDLDNSNATAMLQQFPGSVIYTSLANIPALRAVLEQNGVTPNQWSAWIAHYTGHAHICDRRCALTVPGMDPASLDGLQIVGTQYSNPDWTGANYDLSLMTQDFVDRFIP